MLGVGWGVKPNRRSWQRDRWGLHQSLDAGESWLDTSGSHWPILREASSLSGLFDRHGMGFPLDLESLHGLDQTSELSSSGSDLGDWRKDKLTEELHSVSVPSPEILRNSSWFWSRFLHKLSFYQTVSWVIPRWNCVEPGVPEPELWMYPVCVSSVGSRSAVWCLFSH